MKKILMLRIVQQNDTDGYSGDYMYDDADEYADDIGGLFRQLQRAYGRCTSKMYVDTVIGPRTIGWVFEKRERYTDCDKTYLQSTWVELLKGVECEECVDPADLDTTQYRHDHNAYTYRRYLETIRDRANGIAS